MRSETAGFRWGMSVGMLQGTQGPWVQLVRGEQGQRGQQVTQGLSPYCGFGFHSE